MFENREETESYHFLNVEIIKNFSSKSGGELFIFNFNLRILRVVELAAL